ncbi:hypothetical protein [Chitinophaga sp. CF418]|uniref:hypothetical protein n=1 Tax=Chitinophaga sp. CF418 TaxID=1855287 RepID=UPI0009200926|nr:hypothetical protein [Chitinophaga sp. CF418]SHM12317.1 hypothetical protein SAMN05216311_101648 [Chitinophaga sp. CF418]
MNALLENEKQIILNFFEASSNDYWKTIREISAATGVRFDDVLEIIFTSKDFAESNSRRKKGELLYTSRKVYSERAPFWEQLLAAFINRAAY